MMMKCAGCGNKSNEIICNDCQFDSNITMSRTELKNKFKLSDKELYENNKNLIYIDFYARYYSGRKYIIKNVIELMEDLYKNNIITDKQKTSFLKQKKIYDEYVLKQNQKATNKRYIKDHLKDFLHKSNLENSEEKYIETVVENDLENEIMRHLKNEDVDIVSVSLKLIPIVESKIKLTKRRADLDNLIEQTFPIERDKCSAKLHETYYGYIYGNDKNINDVCNMIKLDIDKKNECEKQKRRLQYEKRKKQPQPKKDQKKIYNLL